MNLSDLNEDQLAERWHRAWEQIEALEKALKEDPDYVSAKNEIRIVEELLTQRLETTGATAINTPHGTIHTVGKTTARIMDPEEFWNFVIRTNHPRDFLDLKANMTACRAQIEETKRPVPGVELSTFRRLSITAPKTMRLKNDE